MSLYNPIRQVGSNTNIPCPTAYAYKLQDISASESGRTEDTAMQKMRIGQVVAIDLKWKGVSLADASTILTAFNPEYITVTYLDAKAGTWLTAEFYVGDRNVPLYHSTLGLWDEISLSIIKRSGA